MSAFISSDVTSLDRFTLLFLLSLSLLLDGLDDDELSAVIAHELIHIRNGDT